MSSRLDLSVIEPRLSSRFYRQFRSPIERVDLYFETSQIIRNCLAGLCWPGAGRQDCTLRRDGEVVFHDLPWNRLMSRVDGKSGKSGHRWPRFHSLQEACAYLAEGYRQMEAETPVRNEDTEKKVLVVPERVDAMMPFWRDSPLRRPLETLVEHLRNVMPEGCIPILAGSLSRMEDWTPYADVDLVCVLDRDILGDPAALEMFIVACRSSVSSILQVDPLQHHGPFVLLPMDMECFRTSGLPPVSLERATTLHGQSHAMQIRKLEDPQVAWHALQSMRMASTRLLEAHRKKLDRYTMKYVVSMALLAPSVCCNLLGEAVDKAESFNRFIALVSQSQPRRARAVDRTLARLGELRREWRWSLPLPARILDAAGAKAVGWSRNLNRLPAPALALAMTRLRPGLEQLYQATFGVIHAVSHDQGGLDGEE